MILEETNKRYFHNTVNELLEKSEVQDLGNYVQHGGVSRLSHSMSVARASYKFSVRLGLDVDHRSLIRGALLHDFFLYDWREESGRKGWAMHGFTHPREAMNTAAQHFDLNKKECEIILRHMWPLTIVPPRCKEGMIVSLMDKYCTVRELMVVGKRVLLAAATVLSSI